jgi:hypothetical protein
MSSCLPIRRGSGKVRGHTLSQPIRLSAGERFPSLRDAGHDKGREGRKIQNAVDEKGENGKFVKRDGAAFSREPEGRLPAHWTIIPSALAARRRISQIFHGRSVPLGASSAILKVVREVE